MDTFNFPFHTQSTEYPEGYTASLGNSYQYSAEPTSVDQRTFKLQFPTMFYYKKVDGTIDLTKMAQINMGALEAFYLAHRMWLSFIYPHPVYGNVNVRFSKPLAIPAGIMGGNGSLPGFGLEFIEQP